MHETSARAAVGMTIGMAFDFTICQAGDTECCTLSMNDQLAP